MDNPLRTINGNPVACPSKYQLTYSDVSQSDSGRTEDGKMWKLKIGQLVKIELEWPYMRTADLSAILQAFDQEYFTVEYFDVKRNAFRTAQFYAGDRSAPMYNAKMDLWSNCSFNIIERMVS